MLTPATMEKPPEEEEKPPEPAQRIAASPVTLVRKYATSFTDEFAPSALEVLAGIKADADETTASALQEIIDGIGALRRNLTDALAESAGKPDAAGAAVGEELSDTGHG